MFLVSNLGLGQSILLGKRKPRVSRAVVKKPVIDRRNPKIDFVEFREASMGNVLTLIKKYGGIKGQYQIDMSAEVNLRLVDTNWSALRNVVLEEARPLEKSLGSH
jgi:hypothetical protein